MAKIYQLKSSTSSVHDESATHDDESLHEDVCSPLEEDVSESAMSQVLRPNSDKEVDHNDESEDQIMDDWENDEDEDDEDKDDEDEDDENEDDENEDDENEDDENEDDENEDGEDEDEARPTWTRTPSQPHFTHAGDTSKMGRGVRQSKQKLETRKLPSTQTNHSGQMNALNDEGINAHPFKIWHLFASG